MGELLKRVTDKLGLQIDDHFLCFHSTSTNSFVPDRTDQLTSLVCRISHHHSGTGFHLQTYSSVEIRRKTVYQITLNNPLELAGIEIATELHREYSLQVVVCDVKPDSEAERLGKEGRRTIRSIEIGVLGVRKDDEIVIVNSFIVQELDLDTLDRYFNQIPIVLTLRSSR